MMEYNVVIKEHYYKKEEIEFNVYDMILLVIDIKTEEFRNESPTSDDYIEKKAMLEKLMEDKTVKFIYNNVFVLEEDGEEIINISNGLLARFFNKQLKSHRNYRTDVEQLQNSIIISLVTSFELLIAEIFKDFILNIDHSDFIEKKSITFSNLAKIGDIEEARNFLVDQYIEELLRSSFNDWINEFDKKMKINIDKLQIVKENSDLDYMNETFQRRHLLIHNDGIVNDLYLTKTKPFTTDHVEKGDSLEPTSDYILSRIKLFKKVGIILIYMYSTKRYRRNMDQFFGEFNDLLLELIKEGCSGARYIYNEIYNNTGFNHVSQLMSRINYFLSYRLNNEFELIRNEVEEFYTETLSIEYRMAKKILLGDTEEAFEFFKSFVKGFDDDDEFLNVLDWPLIKLVRQEEVFDKYIREKMESILPEEGEEVEKLTRN